MFYALNFYTSAISRLLASVSIKVLAVVLLGCVCHAELNNTQSQSQCTRQGPCQWLCTNASMFWQFDLNPMLYEGGRKKEAPLLKEIPGSAGSSATATFSYDPCRPYNDTDGCTNVSMCQSSQKKAVGLFDSAEHGNFTVGSDFLNITYRAAAETGSGCPTQFRFGSVFFYCDTNVTLKNSSVSELPTCTYSLNITSKHACPLVAPTSQPPTPQPPAPPKKLSIGSILLIVFCVCLFIYIVGGILFLRFVRNARGVEQIPNYSFWILIPGLIKDGFVFTCTKIGICKGDQVYEKI